MLQSGLAPSLILSFFLVVLSNRKSPMAIKGLLPNERIGLSAGIQILLAETVLVGLHFQNLVFSLAQTILRHNLTIFLFNR